MLDKYAKLVKDEYINASNKYTNYDILQWAAANGYSDIVELLLKNKQIDPSDYDNLAIRWAAENGHLNVVKLLCWDERVDSNDWYNSTLQAASENNHTEIEEFIKDGFGWTLFYEPDEEDYEKTYTIEERLL